MDRTLVIGPAWVGDMMMAQSLLKAVKAQIPDTVIDVLAPDWSRPLTARMPEVSESISMPLTHGQLGLAARYRIAKNLPHTYQRCFVLPNSFKSALIPFWANIPTRIGWRGECRYVLLNDLRVLDKTKYPLMVQRYVALAYPKNQPLPHQLPNPKLQIEPSQVAAALNKYDLSPVKGSVITLCPGAEFGASKRWPVEYYAQAANHFQKLGYQIWILGSNKDFTVAEQINQFSNHLCVNLCGKTSLAEAIDLMSLSACVITNDSGLMHIAAALDRPLVAVYGSTSPNFTPPLSEKASIVKDTIACSPCFERECPYKHHQCMKNIQPQKVIEATMRLIAL